MAALETGCPIALCGYFVGRSNFPRRRTGAMRVGALQRGALCRRISGYWRKQTSAQDAANSG